ncbi:MAG: hypothetical protein ACYDAZ_04785 [Thermoplasmataceae archaeon]
MEIKKKRVLALSIVLVILSASVSYLFFVSPLFENDKSKLPEFRVQTNNSYQNYSANFSNYTSALGHSLFLPNVTSCTTLYGATNRQSMVSLQTSGQLFYVAGPNYTQIFLFVKIKGQMLSGLVPKSMTFGLNSSGSSGGWTLIGMFDSAERSENLTTYSGIFSPSGSGIASITLETLDSNGSSFYNFSYSTKLSFMFTSPPLSVHNFSLFASLNGLGKLVQTNNTLSFRDK